ncbi:MAG TPA: hypothetical protein VFR10_01090, partial [bacterium]|nr:hypothetical protein [bacterium]
MPVAGTKSRPAIVRVQVPALPPCAGASIPASCSLPLPQALCTAGAVVVVETEAGKLLPAQMQVLDRWADGSVRWGLIDLLIDEGVSAGEWLTISLGDDADAPSASPMLRIEEDAQGISIDTGVARFRCAPGSAFPFFEVTAGSGAQLDP